MKKENKISLRVNTGQNFDRAVWYSFMIFPCGLLVMIPIAIVLERLFPMISRQEWFMIPPVLFFLFLITAGLFAFNKVHLSKDKVTLTWCGITVKTISPEELRLLCAVGNEWGDYLCLTTHSIDELARMEEKCMLRNYFTKDEVPFLKRKTNYHDSFARKQLIRLTRKPFPLLRKEKTLYLPMNQVLLQQIRELYPDLPYRNYTECKKYRVNYYGDKSYLLCINAFTAHYTPEFTEETVVFKSGKNVKATFPLSTVRAIVRIDVFMAQSRTTPHHLPLLFLSNLSVNEMSEKSELSHESIALRAYKYAYDQGKYWRITTPDCCNLPCTEETIIQLKERCPNAQWLDISDSWFADSP